MAHDALAPRDAAAPPRGRPRRELFLHIGLHKTATSYVQRMALENREALLGLGIGVAPYQDPVSGSHHPMLAALAREGAEAVFDRLAAAPGAKVFASAEDLSHLLNERARAEAVRDAAGRHFDVKVLIVLRRQDMLKESVFGQAVGTFHCGSIEDEARYDYDHDRRLILLEEVFGAANVVVSIYSERERNDVFGAILAAMDVPRDSGRLREVPPQNVSMLRRKRLFLAQVPKDAGDARRLALMQVIRRAVRRSDAIVDDGVRTLMQPQRRHDLAAAHAAGNRALVLRHGLTPPPDFLALPDAGEAWHPPRPVSWREFAGVSRDILRSCWQGRGPLRGAAMAARAGALLARTAVRHLRRPDLT